MIYYAIHRLIYKYFVWYVLYIICMIIFLYIHICIIISVIFKSDMLRANNESTWEVLKEEKWENKQCDYILISKKNSLRKWKIGTVC